MRMHELYVFAESFWLTQQEVDNLQSVVRSPAQSVKNCRHF